LEGDQMGMRNRVVIEMEEACQLVKSFDVGVTKLNVM